MTRLSDIEEEEWEDVISSLDYVYSRTSNIRLVAGGRYKILAHDYEPPSEDDDGNEIEGARLIKIQDETGMIGYFDDHHFEYMQGPVNLIGEANGFIVNSRTGKT